jgi:hypothetical protein
MGAKLAKENAGKEMVKEEDTVVGKQQSQINDLYTNATKDFRPTKKEDYGYFFYPERFGAVREASEWYNKFFSYGKSREAYQKAACERNVQECLEKR